MTRRRVPIGPELSGPIRWEMVPTAGGDVRRLVGLRRADALAFSRSVAVAAPAIRRALGSESHANRIVGWDPTRGQILEPWEPARRRWRREVRRLEERGSFIVVTDARACYRSISPRVVTGRLRALGVPAACVEEIGSWLCVFRDAGVDGLPVGPPASAILADAVMSPGDHAIRTTGAAHVRWVDDVAIFATDSRTRATALEALRRAWASLGLELHDGKTVLLDEPATHACLAAASDPASRPPRLR